MPSPRETKRFIERELEGVPHGSRPRLGGSARYDLYDSFAQRPLLNGTIGDIANMDFEIDAEADWASTDITFHADGGIQLFTPDTTPVANDHAGIRPHLDTLQTVWARSGMFLSDDQPRFSAKIMLTSIADIVMIAGFREDTSLPADIAVLGSDDNSSLIAFDEDNATSGANFVLSTNVAGVDSIEDSGVAVVAQQTFLLEIEVDELRVPRYFIDGLLVGSGPALTAAIDFVPFIAVMTDTTTKKSIAIRDILCSKAIA